MANQIVRSNLTEEELKHYGVLGMKWGVRKTNYQTQSLTKKVHSTTRKFDRGKNPETTKLSKKVRKRKYKVDRSIKRADRFLKKSRQADAKALINRYNRDPAKKLAVERYMKDMKNSSVTLSELRMQLVDIRI